ncbi:MAG: hypothetical protein AAF683_00040 [Pseudomonadota bacterium]
MGLEDREYMKERYRARSGVSESTIWRDGPARLEAAYDQPKASASARNRASFPSGGYRKNTLGAAVLGLIAIVYVIWAQPFGQLIDFNSLPKSGEFRVIKKYAGAPTGTLSFSAADAPIALHLIDANDQVVFIGFTRANETAELTVPAGRWHAVATEGTERSLAEIPNMRTGQPLGVVEINQGDTIVATPKTSKDAE